MITDAQLAQQDNVVGLTHGGDLCCSSGLCRVPLHTAAAIRTSRSLRDRAVQLNQGHKL